MDEEVPDLVVGDYVANLNKVLERGSDRGKLLVLFFMPDFNDDIYTRKVIV